MNHKAGNDKIKTDGRPETWKTSLSWWWSWNICIHLWQLVPFGFTVWGSGRWLSGSRLSSLTDGLSFILGPKWWRENWLLQAVLWSLHVHHGTYTLICTRMCTKEIQCNETFLKEFPVSRFGKLSEFAGPFLNGLVLRYESEIAAPPPPAHIQTLTLSHLHTHTHTRSLLSRTPHTFIFTHHSPTTTYTLTHTLSLRLSPLCVCARVRTSSPQLGALFRRWWNPCESA